MRQRINRPRDVVIDIADDAIARMAAAGNRNILLSRLSRVAGALGKAVKIGASGEGALALAGAGTLYGIGKEFVTEYSHRKQQREMKEKGYTEITSQGSHSYLPGHSSSVHSPSVVAEQAQKLVQGSARHSVPHVHSESGHSESVREEPETSSSSPLTVAGDMQSMSENPYSKAYLSVAKEGPPALQSPLPLKMGAPLPKATPPSTPVSGHSSSVDIGLAGTAAVVKRADSMHRINPMRRAYIKVPRFKIPKDRPYDLVKWDAATNAIANNMMANASED